MINALIHNLLIASLIESLVIIFLITGKKVIISLLGAKWNYALWLLILIPWISVWLPISILPANQTSFHWFNEQSTLSNLLYAPSRHPVVIKPGIIFWVWLSGALLSVSYILMQHVIFVIKLKSNRSKLTDQQLQAIKMSLPEEDGYFSDKIFFTSLIVSPMVCHLFWPKIYIPYHFFDYYTLEEQSYILRHEIIHYKRFDIMANMAILLLHCINWFNPVLVFSYRYFKAAQEVACDAVLCCDIASIEKKKYAMALLKTAMTSSEQYQFANYLLNAKSELQLRVGSLKKHITHDKSYIALSLLFLSVSMIGVLPHIDRYFLQLLFPPVRFFSSNEYSSGTLEDYFSHAQIILSNNLEIVGNNVVVKYADNSKKKVSKYSVGFGSIITRTKMLSFEDGEIDPRHLLFQGKISHEFRYQ